MFLVEIFYDNLPNRGEIFKRRICRNIDSIELFIKNNIKKWTDYNRVIIDIDYFGNGQIYNYESQYERTPIFIIKTSKIGIID